jgi:long-chain acyl-CoA synthetase
MLTHENLAWTAGAAMDLVRLTPEDSSLSYLPLSHIAEQMFSIHAPISIGSKVYFAESIDDVPENLKEVQPTVFFGVPRIWEKFYSAVNAKLSAATGVKAKLVSFAMRNASKVAELRNQGRDPGLLLNARYALGKKLVLDKVKPALGMGRARICVSGAAPVSADILRFFAGLDLIILEVYGQSEDTGPTTFNRPGATRYGTVGPRIPGIDVKIAEDGEILVKGPNVFKGYYKDEAATSDALTDGWLHSGDLGEFDEDGFLSITGRKKDIIITAGGKNIAPKNIESALKSHDVVGEAVVIGDRRKFLSALISLDPDGSERFAAQHGVSVEGLHESTTLTAELQTHIEDVVNPLFARVEHVRKFTVLSEPFSIERGDLTPTLKIKRSKVNENYAEVIDSMYD